MDHVSFLKSSKDIELISLTETCCRLAVWLKLNNCNGHRVARDVYLILKFIARNLIDIYGKKRLFTLKVVGAAE
jgi:hypothetical protein